MIRQLTAKLIMVYLLIVMGAFVLLNFLGSRSLEKRLIQQKKEVLTQEAQMIAGEYGEGYVNSKITTGDLKRQLTMTDRFMNARILLTNASGTVFVDTRSEQRFSMADRIEGFPEGKYYENFEDSRFSPDSLLVVWEPIVYDDIVRGYVCLAVSMGAIEADMLVYMNLLNGMYLVLAGFLLLIFMLLFFWTAYPVYYLKKAALAYAKGEYDVVMNPHLKDEYREIGAAVQFLAEEVQGLEDYRKKFVANISHDFRSPLTSIKGYVEAMKDGTIPYEAQEKYLDVILFETERLTKLTSDLLELNAMDNRRKLDITDFDINAVIKRTAASFEGACTKKRLVLELVFAEKEIYVSADLARIQQVLYNLIDNAIKFSNNDSSIIVSVETKSNKVFVSVKDFGIGIPKDSIKRIWERFYKSDLSRGKDKRGTGLGLPITKEIITAHNENINVISTEGVGTEFIFSLQQAES